MDFCECFYLVKLKGLGLIKVALNPTKNFTCKGRSLLPQHKKLAGEHIGCLPSSTVSWWRHDSCANLTNSQYSVKTVLLGRRLMWLQPTFLCRGSSNRPLHVTFIAGSKASLLPVCHSESGTKIWTSRWATRMIIPVKYWNHSASKLLLSFWY